ncbi:ATP-NAD kinase-like domain-containing protein [Mycotypha africana]|uniref:ATP-NAD kinase-like domain-containing protein n=1 Tax=Mycotypha africana TaxID=64632 RepID=UPI0023011243|nr:ATP-NAD kinase-like domain-containing protein [Mycotypha africana]KAI8992088.1 ATP-NAD kinase-like domain-containing protein [Mycotypha africana]
MDISEKGLSNVETMSLEAKRQVQLQTTYAARLSDTAEVVREVSKKIGKTKVKWDNPKTVMVITKPGDLSLVHMTRDLALWFITTSKACQGVKVYVDEKLKTAKSFKYERILDVFPQTKERLGFWNPELCATQPKMFDFIVTLGGDGTVLFASWLFQNYVPPVIPFNLGSLGFLTPFDFDKFELYLTRIMESGMRVNLRGRLTCTVYRRVNQLDSSTDSGQKSTNHSIKLRNVLRNPITGKIKIGDWCASRPLTDNNKQQEQKEGESINHSLKKFGEVDGEDFGTEEDEAFLFDEVDEKDISEFEEKRQIPCFTTIPVEKHQVINDLVVDRGPSPYMSLLELFGDNKHLTTVQADGLAISTPTGSTAYSLSANGSLTHPEIHATLITPICPHTLSFRPTLVPDSMELRICVPFNSRNTAWVSFDGRGRIELKQGDHVKVTASRYSFPTVCKADQATDWFNSLQKCLHWNKRDRQKSFAIVESNRGALRSPTTSRNNGSSSSLSKGSSLNRQEYFSSKNTRNGSSSPPFVGTINTSNANKQQEKNHSIDSASSQGSTVVDSSGIAPTDEVFAMFIEDDYRSSSSGRTQQDGHPTVESSFTIFYESDDESPEEFGFNGWTDAEIIEARRNTKQVAGSMLNQ